MLPLRPIAFMTLCLACTFSCAAVLAAILLPSFFPLSIISGDADHNPNTAPVIESPPPSPARLLFLGDVMLARGVEWQIGKHGITYPLSDIAEYLSAPDLTIANFEGTIREAPNQELDGFMFDTTPAIAQTLTDAGVDLVSLSNNHSANHGSETLQSTREILTQLGMTPFGDAYHSSDFITHHTIHTIPFAFIGFHAFEEEPESILAAITKEKATGNFVIVFPHWGNEYQHTPSPAQVDAAHMFIDAGASAIIGAHPHVIQTYEEYRGIPIVYSLGNFMFDQDWSVPTQQGLTLGFDVDATSITMSFVPVSVIKSHVTLMNPTEASNILASHNLPSVLKISRQASQNTATRQ